MTIAPWVPSLPYLATLIPIFSSISTAFFPPETLLKPQYKTGEVVPISCLNRTVDTGEHIESPQTHQLQYIPFPTCNETLAPLSLPYLTSGPTNCTLDALPDALYHLLEYYIHSDAPLQCRIPAYPINPLSAIDKSPKDKEAEQKAVADSSGSFEPGFIPLTIALQGALQLSHLHILADINAVIHYDSASSSIVAANAYSIPNPATNWALKNPTPDQGTKVIRNEPLTFVFRTSWYDGLNLPASTSSGSSAGLIGSSASLLSVLLLLVTVAGLGGVMAVVWERKRGKGKFGYGPNGFLGGNKGMPNGYAWTPNGGGGFGGRVGKRD